MPYKSKFEKLIDFAKDHMVMAILCVALIFIIIAGISSAIIKLAGTGAENETNTSNSKYVSSDYINLSMEDLRSLNPLTSTDKDTYDITQLIFSSLFTLDDTLNIQEDLVDSYTCNSDNGTVNIKLKKNLKFSDGSTLDASDVKYTVAQIKSIGSDSPYYRYANKIDTVGGSADSVTIRFKNKNDAALDNLVFPIVSSADYSKNSNTIVGSGMYKVSSYSAGDKLVLVPNNNYYGTKATKNVTFTNYRSSDNVLGLISIEEVTAYVTENENAMTVVKNNNIKGQYISSSEMEYIGFNFKNKNLAEKAVRQAICYSINTELVISENYGEDAILNDNIYYPGFMGADSEGDAYKFDQDEAIRMLQAEGYTDKDYDGILEDEEGKDFTLRVIVLSSNRSRCEAAEEIVLGLNDIGIKATLKKLNNSDYQEALKNSDFDLVIGGYKFDKSYNLKNLFDKDNYLSYNDDVVSAKVNEMDTAKSDDELKSMFKELKQDLIEDVPYYCICYRQYTFASVARFSSDSLPTFYNRYKGIETWEWDRTITPDTASDTYEEDEK